MKVLPTGSLLINGMTMQLAGEYTCVASNMAGTGSATISLSFLGLSSAARLGSGCHHVFPMSAGVLLPQIVVPPVNTHAFPGENVLLRCQGDQHTDSYHWLRSGQPLVSSTHAQVVIGTGLNITNVTVQDSGVYTCVAMGNSGSVNASAILTVTGPLLSCEGMYIHDIVWLQNRCVHERWV